MVCGLLVFSDLCFEEKFGNIEFGFEFELDFELDSKLDLELDFVFHIFHSNSLWKKEHALLKPISLLYKLPCL